MDEAVIEEVAVEQTCNWWECAWNTLQNVQFWYGVVAGIVILFILWAILKCCMRGGNSSKMLEIEDSEQGRFAVSTDALISFVRGLAKIANPKVSVENLKLIETRAGMEMLITIQAPVGTELVEYRNSLREQVFREMQAKLGVNGQLKAINFEVLEMETSANA